MRVTCSSCRKRADIAEPGTEGYSAHPDYEGEVVIWQCPNPECGAKNAIERDS